MLFSRSTFTASTLDSCKACSGVAGKGSGMILNQPSHSSFAGCQEMHICTVVQEAILGWHLPNNIAPHSRSHVAFVEVSYGVSWVTKGYWQPVWRA